MIGITLFHAPGACSRVTLNALEEIGQPFAVEPVDFGRNGHRAPEFLAINPDGKVPALRVGDAVLTENAAILHFLNARHPAAGLLPPDDGTVPLNAPLEDLVWCSSTLHPMTRQVRMPIRFTSVNPEGVRADGIAKWQPVLDQLSARLDGGRWWYGARWSIIDVYLYWTYSTAASGGLDLSDHPALADHTARVRSRPSFERALALETRLVAAHGLLLPPGATL